MKRLFQLTMLVFALVLINTGCEKNEVVKPKVDPIITVSELIGYWEFVQTEYDGNVFKDYYDVHRILGNSTIGAGIVHDVKFYSAPSNYGINIDGMMDMINTYYTNEILVEGIGFRLDIRNNLIKFGDIDNFMTYEVIEYDRLNKIVRMKRVKSIGDSYLGAIFTWKKQ